MKKILLVFGPRREAIKMATLAGKILGVGPNIQTLPNNTDNVELVNYETAIQEADIHVVLVDHQKFKLLDSHRLQSKIKGGWG